MEREPGNQILEVQDLKAVADDGTVLFDKVNFQVEKEEKVVFISHDPRAMTALFEIINGNQEAAAGTYSWGVTITTAYLPLDNTEFFDTDLNMLDWRPLNMAKATKCISKRSSDVCSSKTRKSSRRSTCFRVVKRCAV